MRAKTVQFQRVGEILDRLKVGLKSQGLLPSLDLIEIGKIYQAEVEGDFGPDTEKFLILDKLDNDIMAVAMEELKILVPRYKKFLKDLNFEKTNSEEFYKKHTVMMDEIEDRWFVWTYNPDKKVIETVLGFKVSIDY